MLHLAEIFILTLVFTYVVLTLAVKLKHYITKDKSKSYRLAIVIFSVLAALMVTYLSLGR